MAHVPMASSEGGCRQISVCLPALTTGRFVSSTQFDIFFCVVILLNTVVTLASTRAMQIHRTAPVRQEPSKDGPRIAVPWATTRLRAWLPELHFPRESLDQKC